MDKNMINIDELFRKRLDGAEEAERPGAWGDMRALLDKEMPSRKVALFPWRRYLLYLGVMLAASTAGITGYNYYTNNTVANNSTDKAALESAPLGSMANNSVNNRINDNNGRISATETAAAPTTLTNENNNDVVSNTTVAHNANSSIAPVRNNPTIAGNIASNNNSTNNKAAKDYTTSKLDKNQPNTSASNRKTLASNTPHKTSSQNTRITGDVISDLATKQNNATQNAVADNNYSSSVPSVNNTALTKATNNGHEHGIVAQPRKYDTIAQIQIHYRRVYNHLSQKTEYIADTISRNFVPVAIKTEHNNTPEFTAAKSNTTNNNTTATTINQKDNKRKPIVSDKVYAASNSNKNAVSNTAKQEKTVQQDEVLAKNGFDANNLVSLSAHRTDSRLKSFWNTREERWFMLMQQINMTIDKTRFYWGGVGGVAANTSTNFSLPGFQVGLFGNLVFNERWSMVAEFKFFNRFNGNQISDNYNNNTNIVAGNTSVINGQTYREYTWTQDKVTHGFNFTSVRTLEAPVTLRYNVGRIFGEAGINLMYAFAINAEEIEKAENKPTLMSQKILESASGEIIKGGKYINYNDLGARFGMGYAVGLGYQFSPALTANIRVVQNIWDNTTTSGSKKVSSILYNTPSAQLTLSYRFRQGVVRK